MANLDSEELPELAAKGRFTITMGIDAVALDGQKKSASTDRFQFFCDEPAHLGGKDEHPQPLTYVAAGVGFCLLTQLKRYAEVMRIDIDDARCRVEFDWYSTGSVRAGTIQSGATACRAHITVRAREPQADVARLVELAERGCFASQMVQSAVPMSITTDLQHVLVDTQV